MSEYTQQDECARERGTVARFWKDRGYGFIVRPGAPDLWFHVSQVLSGSEEELTPGREVDYEVGHGRLGKDYALRLAILR